MDRDAELAADARVFLMFERENAHRFTLERLREITLSTLARSAKNLGFTEMEIPAAIEAAMAAQEGK